MRITATFCGVAPGRRAGRVNREGVEIKITKPSKMAHTVARTAELVRIMAKKRMDWATPEKRNSVICRLSFLARTMPRIVPGIPVKAIIREINCASTVKSGCRGNRYSMTVYITRRPVMVKRNL